MSSPEMFQALHPDPQKQGMRVTKATYDAYKAALLKVIPLSEESEEGIEFGVLSQEVRRHLTPALLESTSPGWWVTTVKLDLEARGVIERVNAKGRQRVRQR